MIDDCIYEDKHVKEAIKRLPKQIREERDFRISRALLLSNNKEMLPKDEWTKWEDVSLLLYQCRLDTWAHSGTGQLPGGPRP